MVSLISIFTALVFNPVNANEINHSEFSLSDFDSKLERVIDHGHLPKSNKSCNIDDYIGDYKLIDCKGESSWASYFKGEDALNYFKVSKKNDSIVVTFNYLRNDINYPFFRVGGKKTMRRRGKGCIFEVLDKSHYLGLRKEWTRLIFDPENKGHIYTFESVIGFLFFGLDPDTTKHACALVLK